MGILPIDVATMAPKSMEVSHLQQTEHVRQEMHEAKAETAFFQDVKRNQEKTVQTEKGDNEEYRYDAREGKKGQQQQKGKREKKKEEKPDQKDYQTGRAVFDVKI